MRWDFANEIDWRSLLDGDGILPNVEKDLQERLHVKALCNKYFHKATDGSAGMAEDA